jgi:hypothetical protein
MYEARPCYCCAQYRLAGNFDYVLTRNPDFRLRRHILQDTWVEIAPTCRILSILHLKIPVKLRIHVYCCTFKTMLFISL